MLVDAIYFINQVCRPFVGQGRVGLVAHESSKRHVPRSRVEVAFLSERAPVLAAVC